MRIATWNINSIRARAERAVAFLERADVDVLALQETKCKSEQFPVAPFEALGYEVAAWGVNQWNGVAIVSRVGLEDVREGFPGQPGFSKDGDPVLEPRAIGARCGGVDVWSLYVPHGRAIGDPHYTYKLEFLERLRLAATGWLEVDPTAQVALTGDWNVVPLDTDVWDVSVFEGATHVTPPERAAFEAFAEAGFTELSRRFVPDEHRYTYWDYQQLRFPRNEGMRIDFAYASPALAERATGVTIERDERKGKGASDHVPVVVELAD